MMLRDSRSVSPIVGIILMTLITVILATAIFKISNVYFQPAPNAILDVELYTVDNANATKIVVRDLGGDPIYFKNKRLFVYLNGHRFNFHPFTESGQLMAGDVGVMVVPFPSKVGQTVEVKLAVGGMSLFSGEWATVFYSKKVTVQKSRVLSVENGLLAEWHFEHKYPNETAFIKRNPSAKIPRFYDLSGRGNHLIYGAYDSWDSDTMWVKGVNGLALNFKPKDSAYGAFWSVNWVTGKCAPTKGFTVELWVYPRTITESHTLIELGAWYRWIYIDGNGKITAVLGINGTANAPQSTVTISSNTKLQPHHWYYIVVTYDNKYIRIYINGKLDKEEYHPGYITPPPYDFTIYLGSHYGNLPYYDGFIDEVYIWNRALTPQEIKERFEMYADKVGH